MNNKAYNILSQTQNLKNKMIEEKVIKKEGGVYSLAKNGESKE